MLIFLFLLSVLFAAALNATVGFGDSMLNMVLLSNLLAWQTTSPLVALLSLSSTLLILLASWRDLAFKQVLYLLIAALVCVPLGVYWSSITDLIILKTVLGALIVLIGLYNLFSPKLMRLENDAWGLGFGALAGLMGGAFNITGPPAVLFGVLKAWNAQVFRANLQGFFLPLASAIVLSHGLSGNFNYEVFSYYAYALPMLLFGHFLGSYLNRQLKNPQAFAKYVYVLLIILGASLWF